ncbi:hypothetical protein RND81_03G038300 [Saponaria officinalis]|uniref:Uncharacterized protein n=1 Tax=Saponaria officinalis TaxID=3572 RepID=A0AAW1M581_SAPOF
MSQNLMATTTTTLGSCNDFCSSGVRVRSRQVRATTSSNGTKLDGVAMWVINGLATAFFASLERCSCVHVNTVEDADDVNELPLIYNDGNANATTRLDGNSCKVKRKVGGGKKYKGYAYDD